MLVIFTQFYVPVLSSWPAIHVLLSFAHLFTLSFKFAPLFSTRNINRSRLVCLPERSSCFSTRKVNLFVSDPSDRATCLSLKKGHFFVHYRGQLLCPSKRTTSLSTTYVNFFVPEKGHPVSSSKRVNQKGQLVCPPKRITVCPAKRATWLSNRMIDLDVYLFAPQKSQHVCSSEGVTTLFFHKM